MFVFHVADKMELNLEKLNTEYRNISILSTQVFNEQGTDLHKDQLIIGGNPTGIANMNTVRHRWASTIYNQMVGNFWIPQTVDMSDDRRTKVLLSAEETKALYDTLGFLIFMDSFQVVNLPNISEVITAPVVKFCISVQEFQETVHTQSYQFIAETLLNTVDRDAIYNRWRDVEPLKERILTISKIANDYLAEKSLSNFYKVIVANYILEGLYFYQGFNFFDQLSHRNKLVQCAKQIDFIRRDEHTHKGIFINILKEIGIDSNLIIAMFKDAVRNEIKWCHYVYGDRIMGISKKSSEQFVKWLANDCLNRLGIPSIYENVDNPYKHLELSEKQGGVRENFFEQTVTSYDNAGSLEGWDQI